MEEVEDNALWGKKMYIHDEENGEQVNRTVRTQQREE